MMRRWVCQAEAMIRIVPVDPILVRTGYPGAEAELVPVRTNRFGGQTYYLPATSLKGSFRSHFERIARSLVPGSVCLPYVEDELSKPESERTHPYANTEDIGCGYRATGNSKDVASRYRDCCAACRTFGSLGYAGRLSISDAYPAKGSPPPKTERRNGVGIDRRTGGSVKGALFDLVAVVDGAFECKISLVNFELWQLGVLALLLMDLTDKRISIGSGRSRGMGVVRLEDEVRLSLAYVRRRGIAPPESVIGLRDLATEVERQTYGLHETPPSERILLGEPTPKGIRHTFDLSDRWREFESLIPMVEDFLEQWTAGALPKVAES